MLKREYRLTKKKDFDRVFKEGRYYHSDSLMIKCAPNGLLFNRFGILVSTKVSKLAVDRNRIKRQIRAITSLQLPFLKSGKDIVIVTFPLILDKKLEYFAGLIKAGFKRLKLYVEE